MTDSVHCSLDSANTFTCEVDIGPDPAPAPGPSAPATPTSGTSPAPLDPAVLALVTSYQKVVLPTPDVSYFTASAIADCTSTEAGLALALAAVKPGPLAALAMLKASFDVSKCFTVENNDAVSKAGHAEGAAYCASEGGTVTSVVGDRTYCSMPGGSL